MEITSSLIANLDFLGNWGILTTNRDLVIIGWNRWLEKASGKPAHAVIGKQLYQVFPELPGRGFDSHYQNALNGQAAILSQRLHKYLVQLRLPDADHTLSWMQQSARISPIVENNSVCGTITLIEDVTERVSSEVELREQARQLEEANRHKDEFLALLAHELRNPLAPIRNGVSLLDRAEIDPEDAKQIRDMIERQVVHMARLIDDLLDVSRIVQGKVRLQREICDIVSLVQNVANDYRSLLVDSGLDFHVKLPKHPVWIEGDIVRLAQIVANLVQNANKFTNRGGAVSLSVSLSPDNHFVLIEVEDSGIGMTAETIERIFDAFNQAERTLERSKGGLGLGLALVKGFTILHGGTVKAESNGINKGARLTVQLPASISRPMHASHVESSNGLERPIKQILIIEDNHDAAMSLKLLLRHSGFEVSVAQTGIEGVAAARLFSPDVVLCDIGLPGLDGYGVAQALRNDIRTQNAFLIAQSGYGQPEDIRRAMTAGFDVHLIKPVIFQELLQLLKPTKLAET